MGSTLYVTYMPSPPLWGVDKTLLLHMCTRHLHTSPWSWYVSHNMHSQQIISIVILVMWLDPVFPFYCLCTCLTLFSQQMSMTQWSNLKGFSPQTYFFHSTGHYNECVAAHNSVPPDPTMTVDNVTQVFNKIEGDKTKVMGGNGAGIPDSLIEEIKKGSSTDTEENKAYAHYYVNYHPDASWEHLTRTLYRRAELAAARESKSFVSTGKCCHYITYWYNCYAH